LTPKQTVAIITAIPDTFPFRVGRVEEVVP